MAVSLQRGLVLRLITTIVVLFLLDAVACYYTAMHFSNVVYDRWLVDSARSLTTALKVDNNRISLDLPHVARDIFQFDEIDKTYFRVSSGTVLIAGDTRLPQASGTVNEQEHFLDTDIDRIPVRLVAVKISRSLLPAPVLIEVAETLNKRLRLRREIVLAMVAPQLTLIATAIAAAWLGISLGLKPLTTLAEQLEARGHDNLSPVPEQGLPREARVLVSKMNGLFSRLEHSMAMQRRFIADAAHQLRTPLAAVLLHAERAEQARSALDREEGGNALRSLHSAAQRATRVSHQLLSLARAEPDAIRDEDFKPTDLVALARRIGEEWIPHALVQNSDFGLAVPSHPVIVPVHAGLLTECISNLIDNALRYAGPHSCITLSVSDLPVPTIAVEDNGPGVPLQERARIFERFYRLPSSNVSGCGLGLSIVSEIAKTHRAKVRVEDASTGRGARFVIAFA